MLCLDTYPLMEIHFGHPGAHAILDEEITITDITLAEFYGLMYRQYNEKTAEYWYRKLLPFVVRVPTSTMMHAMRFKVDNAKDDLSFFDCVGYIYAQANGMDFVTGDKAFKGMKGVRFIG